MSRHEGAVTWRILRARRPHARRTRDRPDPVRGRQPLWLHDPGERLWALAWLTTNGLFLRLRGLPKHACTDASEDRLRNTRTTRVGWLARLTVAPHQVAYHLEHHLLMTVPFHQLPALHRLLMDRGAVDDAPVASGYGEVLRAISAG